MSTLMSIPKNNNNTSNKISYGAVGYKEGNAKEYMTPEALEDSFTRSLGKSEVSDTQEQSTLCLPEKDSLGLQLLFEKSKSAGFELDALQNKMSALKALIQSYEIRIAQLKDDLRTTETKFAESRENLEKLKSDYIHAISDTGEKYNLGKDWKFDPQTGQIL